MTFRTPAFACIAVIALAGCERGAEGPAVDEAPESEAPAAEPSGEMTWARAAIERNPNLEVLAVDSAAGVFTIRHRDSGDVQAVKLADIAAVPLAMLSSPSAETVVEPVADAGSTADVVDDSPVEAAAEELPYKVERSGGQVRVTGPGVSIVSAGTATTPSTAPDARQRRVDPIICDGPRVLQLNDRHIFVDGDAVTARGGCQLHITNSRIAASGTGVVIRDAVVHITNSEIEGAESSFDAGADATVILQGATLKGVTRRAEGAEVQEQGRNQWQ
jgi:hypothetical protein